MDNHSTKPDFCLHEPNHAEDCRQFVDWSEHTGWQTDYQQIGKGTFDGSLMVTFAGDIQINHCRFNRELIIHASPPEGSVSFIVPCSGGRRGIAQGIEWEPYHVLMAPSGAEGFLKTAENLSYYVVVVPNETLAASMQGFSPGANLLSRNGNVLSLDTVQSRALVQLLSDLIACRSNGAHTGILDVLTQGVLGNIEEIPGPYRLRSRLNHVRRAKNYIEDRLYSGVTITEVSEALELSRRTLELSFRDVLDTSPLVYLRTRQLTKIREALKGNPQAMETSSISDIAAWFGQSHPGHFSRHYKELFGELPSETIARGPS